MGSVLAVFVAAVACGLLLRRLDGTSRRRPATAPEKVPFTGGEPPATHALSRFHARYYPMTLVFVAFDMEMVFMYPWAVVFVREGLIAFVEMGMFIGILLLGVLYAWRERAFAWT